jgi:transcriptional regulator with XRE-family HTH domain
MTQEDVALAAGLALRHLQKIEAGQVNVTLETLSALATALRVDVAVLLQNYEENL